MKTNVGRRIALYAGSTDRVRGKKEVHWECPCPRQVELVPKCVFSADWPEAAEVKIWDWWGSLHPSAPELSRNIQPEGRGQVKNKNKKE